MSELKPCPFCGCKSVWTQEIIDGFGDAVTSAYVACDACCAQGPECNSVDEAEWQWNQPTRDAEIMVERPDPTAALRQEPR